MPRTRSKNIKKVVLRTKLTDKKWECWVIILKYRFYLSISLFVDSTFYLFTCSLCFTRKYRAHSKKLTVFSFVILYFIVPLYSRLVPTNQENWPNVFPYMALYWANVLAIVPTLGQLSWFVGVAHFVSDTEHCLQSDRYNTSNDSCYWHLH